MPSVHPNSLECTLNVRARTRSAGRRLGTGPTKRTQDPAAKLRNEPNDPTRRCPLHHRSSPRQSSLTTRTNPRAPYIASETNPSRVPKPPKRTRAITASHRTNPRDRPTMRIHDTGVPASGSPRLPIRCPDDSVRTVPGHEPSSRIRCPRKKPGPRARLSQSGRQNVWERRGARRALAAAGIAPDATQGSPWRSPPA